MNEQKLHQAIRRIVAALEAYQRRGHRGDVDQTELDSKLDRAVYESFFVWTLARPALEQQPAAETNNFRALRADRLRHARTETEASFLRQLMPAGSNSRRGIPEIDNPLKEWFEWGLASIDETSGMKPRADKGRIRQRTRLEVCSILAAAYLAAVALQREDQALAELAGMALKLPPNALVQG